MNLSNLLQELENRSVYLSANDGKLTFTAPQGAVDDDLKIHLRAHKQALLEIHGTRPEPPSSVDRQNNYAQASMAQRGLWFIEQTNIPADVYAVHLAWRCRGHLDISRLQAALYSLVTIHESLRTTLSVDETGELLQTVNPPQQVSLAIESKEYNDHEWRQAAQNLLAKPFSLNSDQLLRAAAYQLGPNEHIVLITTHHCAVDGWSVNLITEDLKNLYAENVSASELQLNTPSYQYLEYAKWQDTIFETPYFEKQLSYWKQTLSGTLPVINLPTDHIRPAVRTYRGGSVRAPISAETLSKLHARARESETTLYTLLFCAFSVFLSRFTHDEELIIGTPVSNRGHTSFDKTVGLFANTIAIRTVLEPTLNFVEYLNQFQTTLADAISAQDVPFEILVRELSPERDLSRNPIYQVMFTLQNVADAPLHLQGLETESILDLNSLGAKFDLALEINVHASSSELHFNYSQDLFDKRTIETLATLFNEMLEQLDNYSSTPLKHITLLTESDRKNQLALGCGVATEVDDTTIYELFTTQVNKTPEKTALIYNGSDFSYKDINTLVDSISAELHVSGCVSGDIIAICLPRSVAYIATVLAVLKCGAIWCPLSPALPKKRMDFLLSDSGSQLIIVEPESFGSNSSIEIRSVENSGVQANVRYGPEAAYLFYTSGSSGVPKGVIGSQRGMVNRLQWMWRVYPFVTGETSSIKTSTGFIDSLWESFGALLAGFPSLIIPESDKFDLQRFVEVVEKYKVSRLVVVPSLLAAMLEEIKSSDITCQSLRICICSGEPLSSELANTFYSMFPNAKLLNLYGLSEITADATYYEVPKEIKTPQAPIGRSIDNSIIYVLDNYTTLTPLGLVGDIYIAGEGLAKGYHQQPELTNEVFVKNPFHGGRMFKTGDRGYWNKNGYLEYTGRLDKQCKILGIRVDCGEIESALEQLNLISRARVFAIEKNGIQRLIAHVEINDPISLDEEKIRHYLKTHLPAYLIPSNIFMHTIFPELSNGKIDQLTLKETKQNGLQIHSESILEKTAEQQDMLSLWENILGSKVPSVNNDFFDLGGHSLLAVTLINAINHQYNSNLTVSVFFKTPTPQGCIAALTDAANSHSESSLSELQLGNGQQRIFMMPPSSYTSAFFQRLKINLPDECGLFSIDTSIALEHSSLESLCTRITSDILVEQPEGPWFIGGACYGNHLALEISNQLKTLTGGDVTLLLIDSSAPLSGPTWTFQSLGQADNESRLVYLTKVLINEFKRDQLRTLLNRRIRKIRGKLNPVVGQFNKVGFWQDKHFVKYRARLGSANIVLIQSKQFQNDLISNKQWQALTSEPIHYIPIAAKHHGDLTSPKSKHWKQVADEMMTICFPFNDIS